MILIRNKAREVVGIPFLGSCFSKEGLFLFHQLMNETVRDERFRLFFGFLFSHDHHVTEHLRSHAGLFLEQDAEGADAFEAHFVTNFSYGQILLQQFLRFEQAFAGKVLVWRFPVHAAEEAVEMEAGKESAFGDTFQVDGCMEIIVHIHFGGNDALAGILCQFHDCKLPNRFDEIPEHHEADHNFQEGANEKTDKGTESGFERTVGILSTDHLAHEGADEWTDDHAPGAHPESEKETECTAPGPVFSAAKFFGAVDGNYIIQDDGHYNNAAPEQQEPGAERIGIAEVLEQEAQPGNRRSWQNGQQTAQNTQNN